MEVIGLPLCRVVALSIGNAETKMSRPVARIGFESLAVDGQCSIDIVSLAPKKKRIGVAEAGREGRICLRRQGIERRGHEGL